MAEEPVEEINYWILKEFHRLQAEHRESQRQGEGVQAAPIAPLEDADL